MKNIVLILTALFLYANTAQASKVYKFEPNNGHVSFITKGWPSLITIKGQGPGLKGELKETNGKLNGSLEFDLTQLKTGIDLRDDHMKNNYLHVDKYPTATLTIKNLEITTSKEIDFQGEMLVHGTKKLVKGAVIINRENGKVTSIEAKVPMKLGDFQIDIPSYQGITVAEKVTIEVSSKIISMTTKEVPSAEK